MVKHINDIFLQLVKIYRMIPHCPIKLKTKFFFYTKNKSLTNGNKNIDLKKYSEMQRFKNILITIFNVYDRFFALLCLSGLL